MRCYQGHASTLSLRLKNKTLASQIVRSPNVIARNATKTAGARDIRHLPVGIPSRASIFPTDGSRLLRAQQQFNEGTTLSFQKRITIQKTELITFSQREENATHFFHIFPSQVYRTINRFARFSDLSTSVINSHHSNTSCEDKWSNELPVIEE